jgi:hypothetical protein
LLLWKRGTSLSTPSGHERPSCLAARRRPDRAGRIREDPHGPDWTSETPPERPRQASCRRCPSMITGLSFGFSVGNRAFCATHEPFAPAVKGSTRTGLDWTGQRRLHSPPLKRWRSAENAGGKPTGGLEPPTPSLRGIRFCPAQSLQAAAERLEWTRTDWNGPDATSQTPPKRPQRGHDPESPRDASPAS